MAGDTFGEVGEGGVDFVPVIVPVAIAGGIEAARGRGAGEGKLSHARLDHYSAGERFVGWDGGEHGNGHGLVEPQCGSEGVLPDTVAAGNHDREQRTAEAAREVERSWLEGQLDAENRALGEAEDAVPGLDGSADLAVEGSGRFERTLWPDEHVSPTHELLAEHREAGKLVAGDGCKREGKVAEGEAVGEPFVQGDDHVALVGIYVLETADANAQADKAGGELGPPALGHTLS